MRVSCNVAVFLTWLCAVAFSADIHATTMLPVEPVAAGQSRSESHADSRQGVAIWDQAAIWIWAMQNEFLLQLTQELESLRGKDGVGWALVLTSFLYGVLHAAGPGHGKIVLTTYLLTHRSRLNRGIVMGATAALLQGITALLLIYIPIGLGGWLPIETDKASLWATRVSFVLLAIVGLYLLIRAAGALSESVRRLRRETGDVRHDHADHAHGAGRGCRHMPSAAEIDTVGSRHAAAGVVLAIGLRPCSGAVFVLILAIAMDLIWYGALSVIAMSIGTAITIVVLAIIATEARAWASTVVAHRSPLWTLAAAGLGALGGTLLILLALWALNASFAMKPAMGL
ncbi:MAG: nickel/cobalt transporter [Gemmatimonadetes bacterium]|nr:nickel/cobalt transporter [Gemmatimonadota bacterium]